MRELRAGEDTPRRALTGPFAFLGRIPPAAAIVVALVAVAYHYSLVTLTRGLGLQTPLGYLALVPLVAVVLAWIGMRREMPQRPIHDRQLDYIVGVALIAVAAAVAFLLPSTLAARFWLLRMDLLGLPFFAAGLVALFFGLRTVWTLRFPIAFLFLAWPAPYLPLVGEGIRGFVGLTSEALMAITAVVPIATAVPGADTIFFVRHAGSLFALSVTAACSGVNGLVGFILIGGALTYVVEGRVARRLLWLAAGLALMWVMNVIRILAIFVVGMLFGEHAALDILHPVAGLITFNLGLLGMLWAVPRFGLRFIPRSRRTQAAKRPVAVNRRFRTLVVAAAVAMLFGGLNAGYARYEPLANALGGPRLGAFDVRNAQVADWHAEFATRFEEGRQYFGQSSTWDRYIYSTDAAHPASGLRSSVPIYVDMMSTDDPSSLAAYGIEACYQFHGYQIASLTTLDIGVGVDAQIVGYVNPRQRADWSALWWEWPYRDGEKTRYQRVVMLVANGPGATFEGGALDVAPSRAERFTETDRFLAALARAMVSAHTQAAAR
jgi:exosortase